MIRTQGSPKLKCHKLLSLVIRTQMGQRLKCHKLVSLVICTQMGQRLLLCDGRKAKATIDKKLVIRPPEGPL